MRKLVFFAFAILFFSTSSFSKNYSGGLFIGPSTSWTSSESRYVDYESTNLGYTFGAVIEIGLFDNLDLTTGAQFFSMGGKLDFTHGATGLTSKEVKSEVHDIDYLDVQLNYIAMPFIFKGKTSEVEYSSMVYFLKAGFTPMINTSAFANIEQEENLIIDDHIRMFNIAWNVGGGVEYIMTADGNTRLFLEVMYGGGLLDFSKDKRFDDKEEESFVVYANEDKTETVNIKNINTRINDIHVKFGVLFRF